MSALRAPLPNEHESVGALVQRLGTDVRRIVRAEIALVQVRLEAALGVLRASGVGLAAGIMLALGGFGAVIAGVVLVVATATALPAWLAAFAVGGGLLVIAGLLLWMGIRGLTRGVGEALRPIDVPVPLEEVHRGR